MYSDPHEFSDRINAIISRFLDGQLSFEPAVAELMPVIQAWVDRLKPNEETNREVLDAEALPSGAVTIIAHEMIHIAEGRNEEERKRATDLAFAAMMRLPVFSNGAA